MFPIVRITELYSNTVASASLQHDCGTAIMTITNVLSANSADSNFLLSTTQQQPGEITTKSLLAAA